MKDETKSCPFRQENGDDYSYDKFCIFHILERNLAYDVYNKLDKILSNEEYFKGLNNKICLVTDLKLLEDIHDLFMELLAAAECKNIW